MIYIKKQICYVGTNSMLVATCVISAPSFRHNIQMRDPNARGPMWVAYLVRAITVSVFVTIEEKMIVHIYFIVHSLVATYLVPPGRRWHRRILNITVYLFFSAKNTWRLLRPDPIVNCRALNMDRSVHHCVSTIRNLRKGTPPHNIELVATIGIYF